MLKKEAQAVLAEEARDALERAASGPIADWPKESARYYFVDSDNGDDNAKGYGDTAAEARAVAVRTFEGLKVRLPRNGDQRQINIMVRGSFPSLDLGDAQHYRTVKVVGADGPDNIAKFDTVIVGPGLTKRSPPAPMLWGKQKKPKRK